MAIQNGEQPQLISGKKSVTFIMDTKLFIDMLAMFTHGRNTDIQGFGNGVFVIALKHKGEHFPLAPRKVARNTIPHTLALSTNKSCLFQSVEQPATELGEKLGDR